MQIIIEIEDGKVTVTVHPPVAAQAGANAAPAARVETLTFAGPDTTSAGQAPLELQGTGMAAGIPAVSPLPAAGQAEKAAVQPGDMDAGAMPAELMALERTVLTQATELGLPRQETGDTTAGPAPEKPPAPGKTSRGSARKNSG